MDQRRVGDSRTNEVEGLNFCRARAFALRKKHGRLKEKPERDRRAEKKTGTRELFDAGENDK
jgi:hypothetical protein